MPWGWLALLVAPPLVAWLWRRRGREPVPDDPGPAPAPLSRLGRLEHQFHVVLASHVPDPRSRDGDGLARALRASGVDSAVADHVMRLRDRLRASRYGPRGLGDAAELGAELVQVLRVLGAEPGGKRRTVETVVALAVLTTLGWPVAAQAPSAEALYDAGALRAAADSFAARAVVEPRVAAHWYNLGATLYRAGADGKATAAWTVAARLAPRDPVVRRARDLLPSPDAASEQLLATGLATPGEWALAAGLCWVVGWIAVAGRRRRRRRSARARDFAGLDRSPSSSTPPHRCEWRRTAARVPPRRWKRAPRCWCSGPTVPGWKCAAPTACGAGSWPPK